MFMNQRSTSSHLSALRLYAAFAGFFLSFCPGLVDAWVPENYPKDPFAEDALTQFMGKSVPRTCFEFEGGPRCYFTYVPSSCNNAEKPVPLVVDVHALTQNPATASWYTGWKEIAERECAVVMWPSGYAYTVDEGVWNIQGGVRSEDYGTAGGNNVTTQSCCYNLRFGNNEKPNDTLFLKKATDDVLATFSDDSPVAIDNSRVYITGHSNGGVAALAMAGLYPDTFAAAAIFAGALATPFAEDYSGVPIWWVHGSIDVAFPYHGMPDYIPPTCGIEPGLICKPTKNVGVWSIDETFEYISKQNQCSEKTVTDTDFGNITRFDNCNQDAKIELVTLDGLGHFPFNYENTTPPGACKMQPQLCSPKETKVQTTELAWSFISSHSKPTSSTSTSTCSGASSEL